MTPKHEFEHGTIYNGDCLELMKNIPGKSIDMILADLPYGVTNCGWDSVIPLEPLWSEYKRITKDNAAIVLTATQPFASQLIMSSPKLFRYDLIWEKPLPTGFLNANRMPLRAHEHILVFYKKLGIYNPQKTPAKRRTRFNNKKSKGDIYSAHYKPYKSDNNGEAYPRSVLVFGHDKYRHVSNKPHGNTHPTQKPLLMFEYLIRTYTNEEDTVFDNTIGSGTTAIACHNTGRRFIGMELYPKIYSMAIERIKKETRQKLLFAAA